MGNCLCQSSEENRAKERTSRQIDRTLAAEQRIEKAASKAEVKLLLLGAAETGKSTILKQIRLYYDQQYSREEVLAFRSQILENATKCIKDLINAMDDLKIPYDWDPLFPLSLEPFRYRFPVAFPKDLETAAVPQIVLDAVKTIWEDKGVQYCHSRGSEFHLMDCCAYILDSLDRICDPEYLPSKQDILFAREETQKITESSFQLAKHVLRVYDMGGIRGQRRKWASFFENVHLIVNVVAVSAFDQFTVEDGVTNRVVDSLNIFGSICNHPLFKRTIFILFINKIDLFKIKLKSKRIAVYFRDFQGENSYENGCEYFIKLFLSVNKYKSKKIHVHLTQATDSQEMAKILKSVTMVILKANIKTSRLF
ncbi:guanine nucleotide binding protein, alpha subunit [Obelidium mucronatum]|nr:guanine nucleotide binding protein, alpha subunit [Obelidium mucronatum]